VGIEMAGGARKIVFSTFANEKEIKGASKM
jgi:hypothetical protein